MDSGKILGINTRYYPAQATVVNHEPLLLDGLMFDQSSDPPPTVCVLVAGDIGDYAAYVGHGKAEWVAAHGNKISFREATCHFNGIEKDKYRE